MNNGQTMECLLSLRAFMHTFSLDNDFTIFIPDPGEIAEQYKHDKHAAYWAQVWPASVGLCRFVQKHSHFIKNKTVLELAAGLGLAGLYAAQFAKQVHITDIEPQAMEYIQESIAYNQLNNVTYAVMNWKDAAQLPLPEVVLLSDVNYSPEVFEELEKVILHFIQNKITVILSTPQRLVAKEFINGLLPYCKERGEQEGISVFVL